MGLRKQWYIFLGRLKRSKPRGYRWPKPAWQRVLRLPFDLVLLHIDLLRAAVFFMVKSPRKEKDCLFCADKLNTNAPVKRCVPAARYGNLGVAKVICPCLEPPGEEVADWPCCRITRPSRKIFGRLFSTALVLLICWSSVGVALYLHQPTRRMVARLIKPNRSAAPADEAAKKRERNPIKATERLAEARAQIEKKEWGKARINLLNARAFDESNSEIHHELATVYLQLKQYAGALNELEQCVKLEPENVQFLQEFCWLSAAARKPEMAEPYIDGAPESVKNTAQYKLLLVVAQLRQEERPAALATLQALAEDPEAEAPYLLQAAQLLLQRFNQPATALPYIKKALDLQEEDEPGAMLLMAKTLRCTDDYAGATEWLNRLEQRGFNEPALKLERVEHLVRERKTQDATEQLEALAERHPELSYARARLAELYLSQRRINEAWRTAQALSEERDPLAFAQGHTVLGNIALQSRFFSAAIAHAEKARRTLGGSYSLHQLLARAHFEAGETESAREHIASALALEPQRLDGRLTGAAIDFQLGNETNALATLQEVAAQPALPAPVLVQLGQLALTQGQLSLAHDAYKELLRRDPENPFLLKGLIATLASESSTLPLARQFAEMLRAKYPGSIAAATAYGAVLLQLGKEAVVPELGTFRTNNEAFPLSANLAAQRGRAHQLAGETQLARQYLERALALQPGIPGVREWLDALPQ